MAKTQVTIQGRETVSDASKRASKSLNRLEDNSKSMSRSQSQSLGTLITKWGGYAAAIGGGVAAVHRLITAYSEAEAAERKLRAAAERNPYLNSSSVSRLQEFAEQMQRTTTVSDEVVTSLAQLGATSGRTEGEIKTMVRTAVDLAAAVDMDVRQAYEALQGTLAGTRGELEDYFTEISKLSEEQLRAGEGIDIVRDKVDGMGSELRDTTRGGVQAFQNSWSELMETLGRAGAGLFNPIISGLNSLVSAFENSIGMIQDFIEHIRKMRKVEAGEATIGEEISVAERDRRRVRERISGLQNRIESERQAVRSNLEGFGLEPGSEKFREKMAEEMAPLRDRMQELRSQEEELTAEIKELKQEQKEQNDQQRTSGSGGGGGSGDGSGDGGSDGAAQFRKWLNEMFAQAAPDQVRLNELMQQLDRVRANLEAAASEGSNYTESQVEKLEAVEEYLRDQIGELRAEMMKTGDVIGEFVEKPLKDLLNATTAVDGSLSLTRGATNAVPGRRPQAGGASGGILATLKDDMRALGEAVGSFINQIGAGDALSAVVNGFRSLAQWIWSLLQQTEVLRNFLSDFTSMLVDALAPAANALVNALRPLARVVVQVVSYIGKLLVPIFKMLGQLIQGLMPLFQAILKVLQPLLEILTMLLPPIMSVVEIIGRALAPVLRALGSYFETLGVILDMLSPLFDALSVAIKTVMTPFAALAGTLEWIGNIFHNVGKFISNVVDHPLRPGKWDNGMKSTNLGRLVAKAVNDLWSGNNSSDFGGNLPDFGDMPDTGDTDVPKIGEGVHGGSTSVQRVPDIYVTNNFNGPVFGFQDKAGAGEAIVDAIQAHVGAGGEVTFMEGSAS